MASRQAELGKKRRRQSRGAGSVIAESAGAVAETPAESSVATDVRESPAVAKKTESSVRPRPAASPPYRTQTRARLDRPAAYNYVMPELRRILIMAGTMLAVLIGLSIVVPYLI